MNHRGAALGDPEPTVFGWFVLDEEGRETSGFFACFFLYRRVFNTWWVARLVMATHCSQVCTRTESKAEFKLVKVGKYASLPPIRVSTTHPPYCPVGASKYIFEC